MTRRILIVQGHPDPAAAHFGHALAQAYAEAASGAGHTVRTVTVAQLDFPLLRSQEAWAHGPVPAALAPAQQAILWAEHLVVFFPLWLGGMPAVLKGFFEQVARPGFAISQERNALGLPEKLLAGRSARIVVTMGMPAPVYRWVFHAHSVKALERNILGFVGIAPVHETLVGMVEGRPEGRERALARMAQLGRRGA
ncbi:NAD(P)H-dependent oxidoreductase [Aquincola sp. MAHUQ-54]|uniref:NAD(P)H-dependent oxidoreductase n=1 Tax=Aquincola agrisoli TaxID=3119538 RepID=A0AAW9Q9E4_9BURK